MEFAMLTRNLSFLVPPSTLEEHTYKVSVVLRNGIFKVSHDWLFLSVLLGFTSLYHIHTGEAFSHNLK